MKKVLLITIDYPPAHGGVANYYFNLKKFWPDKQNFFVLDNSENKLVDSSKKIFSWCPAIYSLRQKIQSGFDYIIIGQILPLGTVAFLLSFFLNFKYAVVLHGLDFSLATRHQRKKILAKMILKRADKIICANSFTAEQVKKFLNDNSGKIQTVNPGVDLEISQNANNDLRAYYKLYGKKIILSVGRFVKRKCFDLVIKSLPELLKKHQNVFFVLIGAGEEKIYYEKLVQEFDLQKYVLIKEADDYERNGWYRACDIFAMPARDIDGDYEGFGIVYLEAGLLGKAVLAGDCGGVSDAVIHGVTGLTVDGGDQKNIIATLEILLNDKKLRDKLGEQGMKRVHELFSWDKKVAEFAKIILD